MFVGASAHDSNIAIDFTVSTTWLLRTLRGKAATFLTSFAAQARGHSLLARAADVTPQRRHGAVRYATR